EAIKRAKRLINAEGLHLVEHILLRPRCPEDCDNCDCMHATPCNETHCSFEWQPADKDDPCNNPTTAISLVPGSDPYSFIATIALPAWSARFRSQQRQVEDLLYREAPAHVLLRILWLTPKDLCEFESHYRDWKHWLTWDKKCVTDFRLCDFHEFLFTKALGCLENCDTCRCASTETISAVDACFPDPCDAPKMPGPYDLVNQINEIFCWKKLPCRKTEEGDMENQIDERYTKYREEMKSIVATSQKNDIAATALRFLQGAPALSDYKEIVQLILKNQKPTEQIKIELTTDQLKRVAALVTYYYLDRLVFDHEKIKISKDLKSTINSLAKKGLQPRYTDWNAKQVKEIKPLIDTKMIEELLK
ncbi:MAG TPA: hypothetical protein VGI82_05525, partial [Chitinophagaceae bacterium]